jgi:hypothetical protein
MDENPMTGPIDDMQGIKPTVVFDIPGTHQIGLMNMVDPQGFLKIRVLDPFGVIWGFF